MHVQSVLAKKKAATTSGFPQFILTPTEVLLPFRGIRYVNSCLQGLRHHEKRQWNTEGQTGVAA